MMEDDGPPDLEAVTRDLKNVIAEVAELTGASGRNAQVIARWEDLMQRAVPECSQRAAELVEAIEDLNRPMTIEEVQEVGEVMTMMADVMSKIAGYDRPPVDAITLWYVRNIDERLQNVERRI